MYSDTLNDQPIKKPQAKVAGQNAGLGASKPNGPAKPPHPNGPPHQNGPANDQKPPHPNGPPPLQSNGPPPNGPAHQNGPANDQKPPHPNGPPPLQSNGPPPPQSNGPPSGETPQQNGQIKNKVKMIDFKTEIIKGTSTPAFKFSQVFYYTIDNEVKHKIVFFNKNLAFTLFFYFVYSNLSF